MNKIFKHIDLRLVEPSFTSETTELIMELNYLRRKELGGTTPSHIFFQIKHIFHMLESIASARIEGNRTTILEYIETKIDSKQNSSETIHEIYNMENALNFIEDNVNKVPINRMFLSEIHKIVVKDLASNNEGSKTPGDYRESPIFIAQANFAPPDHLQVPSYMNELFNFINATNSPQHDLLKIALAHHRFVWIHPFDNGNGRTVRLLTYAMLVKQGFNIHQGRIINPTAVFCYDRNKYYEFLALADKGTDEGLLEWCTYMLRGLKSEIEKIDNLTEYDYLKKNIILPAINFSQERKHITDVETKILKLLVEHQEIMNANVQKIFPKRNPADISRLLKNLKKKKMIIPKEGTLRKYVLHFDNNFLLRGIIKALGDNGFLPLNE